MSTIEKPKTMADVMSVLPKDAMEVNLPYALFTTVRVWVTVIVAFYLLSVAPWYLVPLAWIFAGTGLFCWLVCVDFFSCDWIVCDCA